jgi:hypothetical protein
MDSLTPKRWVEQVSAFERSKHAAARYGRNRRVILARRDEIQAALAIGHSFHTIWLYLRDQGQLDTTYPSFWAATRRLGITKSSSKPDPPPHTPAATLELPKPPVQPEQSPHTFVRPSDEPRHFVHNPRPDKKDLL